MVLSTSRSKWMNQRNVIFLFEVSVEFSIANHTKTQWQSNIYSWFHILAWDLLSGPHLLGFLWDFHAATIMEKPSWGWDVRGGFTHSWGLSWDRWDSPGLIRHLSLHMVSAAGCLDQFPWWLRALREQRGKLSSLSRPSLTPAQHHFYPFYWSKQVTGQPIFKGLETRPCVLVGEGTKHF